MDLPILLCLEGHNVGSYRSTPAKFRKRAANHPQNENNFGGKWKKRLNKWRKCWFPRLPPCTMTFLQITRNEDLIKDIFSHQECYHYHFSWRLGAHVAVCHCWPQCVAGKCNKSIHGRPETRQNNWQISACRASLAQGCWHRDTKTLEGGLLSTAFSKKTSCNEKSDTCVSSS